MIAYGVSAGLALACVLLGVQALLHNGASYTNSLSTIVRVTRDPTITRLVANEGDLQGAEPTPRYLKRAEVRLGRCRTGTGTGGQGYDEYNGTWI